MLTLTLGGSPCGGHSFCFSILVAGLASSKETETTSQDDDAQRDGAETDTPPVTSQPQPRPLGFNFHSVSSVEEFI